MDNKVNKLTKKKTTLTQASRHKVANGSRQFKIHTSLAWSDEKRWWIQAADLDGRLPVAPGCARGLKWVLDEEKEGKWWSCDNLIYTKFYIMRSCCGFVKGLGMRVSVYKNMSRWYSLLLAPASWPRCRKTTHLFQSKCDNAFNMIRWLRYFWLSSFFLFLSICLSFTFLLSFFLLLSFFSFYFSNWSLFWHGGSWKHRHSDGSFIKREQVWSRNLPSSIFLACSPKFDVISGGKKA